MNKLPNLACLLPRPAALQKHLHSGAMRAFLCLAGEPKSDAIFGNLFMDES